MRQRFTCVPTCVHTRVITCVCARVERMKEHSFQADIPFLCYAKGTFFPIANKKKLKKNYLQFVCSRISVSRLLCYVFFYVQQLNAHIKKVVMILSLSFYHHPKRINNDFEICLKGLKTMKSC